MTRTPDQVPDSSGRARIQDAARAEALEAAAQRRAHRHRGEPPRAVVDRRWRFTDAVAAARQLGSGGATTS